MLARWSLGEIVARVCAALVQARDAEGRSRELELRGSRTEYRGKPAAECLLVDTTEAKLRRKCAEDFEVWDRAT